MKYSHFLFSQLFYAIHPNEVGYDLIFPVIMNLYDEYETSVYNVDTKGEYECMVEFFKAQGTLNFAELTDY